MTLDWRLPVVVLGVATIGAYGLVLYGFGAFVAPIRDDTGWSNGAIAAAFSISNLGGGVLALGTGRLLDRVGARPVMASTLVIGSGLLAGSSWATDAWGFVTAWGVGGAIVSAGLFYNTTMAVTGRITTRVDRARAFTWLTVLGGLASPIAFPLAGVFVEAWGWRWAIRAMVVFMVACSSPAVAVVSGDQHAVDADDDADADGAGFGGIREALDSGLVRRWLFAGSCAFAGLVAVQVHHVAAIGATGVTVGVASALAGLRGLLSLPGRAAVAAASARVGVVTALRLAYLTMAIGTAALVVAGAVVWVWVFVILTGLAFGSVAPLLGLYATELYGQRRLGTLMGMQQVLFGAAGAAGPFVLGLTVDATDGYVVLLVVATVLQLVALVSFTDPHRRGSR